MVMPIRCSQIVNSPWAPTVATKANARATPPNCASTPQSVVNTRRTRPSRRLVATYAVATSRRDGLVRRVFTTLCGVLAQFGGVALAFAFVATVGAQGLLTIWLQRMGMTISDSQWVYEWDKGLVVVYLYFQIPLMVLVFLPAIEGLRPEWREATQTLGGGSWRYWRHVAGPVLTPPFIGALLLLFANAFSAYATVAVLISQASPVLTLNIAGAMSSEVVLGQANVAKAMALAMVVVVALVMTLQALCLLYTSPSPRD